MSVSTALTAMYNQYVADAATLSDSRRVLQANLAIERWYAAATAHATEEANAIQSYTIAGRSISRRAIGDLARAADTLRVEVEGILYARGSVLIDMSQADATVRSSE
jgi:hypothetical protein